MTDREYEILDELYFTVSFDQLKEQLKTDELILRDELIGLIIKGWAKCIEKVNDAEVEDPELIKKHYREYNFLASKKGLLEHNTR